MNNKYFVVFDFETDSPDSSTCNPVQIGAVVVEPRNLQFVKGGEFNSYMCPPDIHDDDYVEKHKSTIEWHAGILKCTPKEVVERWKKSPPGS